MVGMQASLHKSMQDNEIDLTMKNENDPITTEDILDDGDEFGDFDPEELLRSPLFNDSNTRLNASPDIEDDFGTFGDVEDGDTRTSDSPNSNEEFAESYDQQNIYDALSEQSQSQVLEQQKLYTQQNVQSYNSPIKTASPAPAFVSAFGRSQSSSQTNVFENKSNGFPMREEHQDQHQQQQYQQQQQPPR